MKKIYIPLILASLILITSCSETSPTDEDYKQVNDSFTNTGADNKGVEKAKISDDTNYEATEELEVVSTGETATITSFGSGGTENSGSGQ